MTFRTPFSTATFTARRACAAALAATALALSGCASPAPESASTSSGATAESPYSHVHGISVDPGTKTILIATHDGLYDVTAQTPVKLSETIDLMGFSTKGSVLYGSGHPGKGSTLPEPVGLIKSVDNGKSWEQLSRQGESDFHALTTTASGLVGFEGKLLTTSDGVTWQEVGTQFQPAVLAGTPTSDVVLATTQQGLLRSTDSGKSWSPVPQAPLMQFISFAGAGENMATTMAGIAPDGAVYVSADAGLSWAKTGAISGEVETITALETSPGKPTIWVATTAGVVVSTDSGATFTPASR
ncbi:F510_1955 family glycosylhydrolase [Arthrobacter sp. GMC3]|uniref:F510_1955 family glycosylhydrolase n=1 Tax=Arthrobacter sp. GMC3 TaxID=2058894 RepID=UPI000CE504FE|nr:hypothetical protein [Arthrobacter sp. GMC3]